MGRPLPKSFRRCESQVKLKIRECIWKTWRACPQLAGCRNHSVFKKVGGLKAQAKDESREEEER